MTYTLATAAEVAGKTKPTVFRWIKSGKLSATKAEDGSFRIDPAELHRYLDSIKETPAPEEPQRSETAPDMDAKALQDLVALRFQVEKLEALLATEKERTAELREDREHWREQAQRLAITNEKAVAMPVSAPVEPASSSRPGLLARVAAAVRG